jgi:dienelactone hydrolase
MQEMATALKQGNKEFDFISYAGAGHGFMGKDEIDSMQQSARFLSIRLKKAKPKA